MNVNLQIHIIFSVVRHWKHRNSFFGFFSINFNASIAKQSDETDKEKM